MGSPIYGTPRMSKRLRFLWIFNSPWSSRGMCGLHWILFDGSIMMAGVRKLWSSLIMRFNLISLLVIPSPLILNILNTPLETMINHGLVLDFHIIGTIYGVLHIRVMGLREWCDGVMLQGATGQLAAQVQECSPEPLACVIAGGTLPPNSGEAGAPWGRPHLADWVKSLRPFCSPQNSL